MPNIKRVDKGVSVTLWLDEELLKEVDRIAAKAKISRSRFIRNLVELGMDQAKALDALGVVGLMMAIEGVKEKIRGADPGAKLMKA